MRRRKHGRLSPEAVNLVAARFRVLGEPLRIRILEELREGEKNVSDLVNAVSSTQPNVSKHLRVLQDAGIVGRRQKGNQVYSFIADATVFRLCDIVCSTLSDRLTREARLANELDRGL